MTTAKVTKNKTAKTSKKETVYTKKQVQDALNAISLTLDWDAFRAQQAADLAERMAKHKN